MRPGRTLTATPTRSSANETSIATELVCTAGLPALYTQVLVQQGVATGARYGYLALYNVAYMLDDSVMVGSAVVTLGRRELQERAGRWLKLVSGVAIVALGLLLLLAPGALVW